MKKEHLEVILEDITSKFDLVLAGHEGLRSEIRDLARRTDERFDLVDFKINTLNAKIDGVADELRAHRADTELGLIWTLPGHGIVTSQVGTGRSPTRSC